MAETSGMAEIRGIDVQKLAQGFAEEQTIFKRYVGAATTSAREIRWYQKTAGFLTATSPAVIHNVSEGAQPFVLENSVTRNSSFVRKYFVESPVISDEDVKDADIDMLAMNVRDLTRAVEYKVDGRIWDVLSENRTGVSNINWLTCSGAWSAAGCDPIADIENAKLKIRHYSYEPQGGVLLLNASGAKYLLSWLINTKGSSIPNFATQNIQTGTIMEILGLRVVVSENVTANFSLVGQTNQAATWKSFTPLSTAIITEPGIGTKFRCWEEGECINHDPKAVCLLSGSGAA